MAGPFRLAELVRRFGGELVGDPETLVHAAASLRAAGPRDIVFLHQNRHRSELAATGAAAVIVSPAEREATALPRIICDDPHLYFARVCTLLHPPAAPRPGMHPSATIAPSAQVAPDAEIGPSCVIEDGAEIGARAIIGPTSVIGAGVKIGAGSRLAAGVKIYAGCEIGANAIVHAGAVIGADGFGFAADRETWVKIPQLGRVLIGDEVEIGANTTIDRGALNDTVIEQGVKLDNQIQIGHNCRIGAHTAIAGCAGIAGSVTIGSHCMIGGAAMISGHLEIADRVVIAGGTWVTKSITEPGLYISVIPAQPAREWRRTVALLRGLGRMARRLGRLERRAAQEEGNET
jgi:UDP-3-O-[3-hydroxymyristoyl] glucosamine N-acyltransferase